MKYAIGIPTLNRADLLIPALQYYAVDFPNTDVYIVDNGKQDIGRKIQSLPPIPLGRDRVVIEPEKNIGVAASWNLLCEHIFEHHSHAIILNDDVYWGRKEFEVSMFVNQFGTKGLITTPMDWCNFILPKQTFEEVGKFDEEFYPAYFEDNDYAYRMKLAGLEIMKVPFMLPQVHRVSQTMEKESGIGYDEISQGFRKNKKRYIEKWGGEPGEEKYKTPFNS